MELLFWVLSYMLPMRLSTRTCTCRSDHAMQLTKAQGHHSGDICNQRSTKCAFLLLELLSCLALRSSKACTPIYYQSRGIGNPGRGLVLVSICRSSGRIRSLLRWDPVQRP